MGHYFITSSITPLRQLSSVKTSVLGCFLQYLRWQNTSELDYFGGKVIKWRKNGVFSLDFHLIFTNLKKKKFPPFFHFFRNFHWTIQFVKLNCTQSDTSAQPQKIKKSRCLLFFIFTPKNVKKCLFRGQLTSVWPQKTRVFWHFTSVKTSGENLKIWLKGPQLSERRICVDIYSRHAQCIALTWNNYWRNQLWVPAKFKLW